MLLQEAERRIRTTESQQRLTQLDGWWRNKRAKLNGKSVRVPAEEALSEALWEEMEQVKEDIILKIIPSDASLSNLDTLQVSLETPRRKKKGIGKRSKPTDIRFYRTGSDILDLRVEAKIILRDRDIPASYLSRDGLKRFSDPAEPYTDHEIGGMLAYTISDDRESWLAKIDNALKAATPPIATFKHRVRASTDETLFCRIPYAAAITARNELLVFHMVLEFDGDPNARA
ncbi:MAG: hypothetical protein HYR63_12710 [Proteobacteria bacterium]|nr:hypothetical protein [Pseudomonadota bacterium]MBI3499160.1 hypothetical protein [Pseudomonadota bacterium]